MKRHLVLLLPLVAVLAWFILQPKSATAQALPSFQTEEYATIRWDGRDNTHLLRPNGKVEFLAKVWGTAPRPPRTDERAYYLNLAINALAKEGYQFAGRTENDVIMRRPLAR